MNRMQTVVQKTIFTVLMLVCGVTAPAWATNTTTTTLVVKSGGSAVTTVTAGSVVTLTASVTLAGNPVTTGQVAFCDATAAYCTDIHQLGISQLTLTGSASLSFIPGIGTYSYKAVFIPSGSHAGSTSSASALAVTGTATYPTTTSLSSIDYLGNYWLTATVVGTGSLQAAPTGVVSFPDTSNSNAVLTTASLGSPVAAVTFTNTATLSTGSVPYGVVAADFNGDGIPDFAIANNSSNNVTIALGNGDGTFTVVNTSPATGANPYSIVAGDFNGDGKVDLATTNSSSASVTVLLGNGNGTFSAAATPAVGNGPEFMTTGDFNEDGNQDLAVSNVIDGTVEILLGNGNGTFTAGATPFSGSFPNGVIAGDFNKDGHLDLAVAQNGAGQVQIFLGAGDGTFTPGASVSVVSDPWTVALGDFNGDGNLDLAVGSNGGSSATILLGDGTGNFTAAATSPATGSNSFQIVVGDFNQDGIDDIAVANCNNSGSVTILLGNGDGTFTAVGSPAAGYYPLFLAVADFNGDGVPDIAVGDYGSDSATVLTTQITETAVANALSVTPVGIGAHLVAASYPGSTTTSSSVSSTITLQGVPATTTTLVVSSNAKQVASVASGSVVTLTATVTGLAQEPSVRAKLSKVHPNSPDLPKMGQVNFCDATASDCLGIHLLGTAQITTAGTASMSYVPGIGSYSYKAVFLVDNEGAPSASSVQPLTVTGGYPTTTTIAATGGAGNYTLTATVIGESNISVPIGGSVSFLDMSNSSGLLGTSKFSRTGSELTYTPGLTQATGVYPYKVVTADFNGDGLTDAVSLNYDDDSLTILLGKGDGTFTAQPVLYLGSDGPEDMVVADFNADGIPDLAIADTYDDQAIILLGNGQGGFTKQSTPAVGYHPEQIATGDFNGDGIADLAVVNDSDATVTVLLGAGDGSFSTGATFDTGAEPFGIAVADFNGDHRPDAAIVNYSDETVSILLNNGDGTVTNSTVPVGNDPYLIASGDFNGDGKPDLAITNYDDDTLTILLGKGDGTFTAAASPATGSGPFGLTIADLNRDGKTDIAVSNYDDSTVTTLLGNGDGTFTAAASLPTVGVEPYAIAAADLNGDGVPDLLIANYADNTMSVLLTHLLEGAQAVLTHVAPLGTGTHNVEASYPLTAPYAASVSSTTPLTAGVGGSAVTLTANPASSSSFGDQVVLTATLSPSAPEGVSTNGETITFYNGSTSIGTGTLASGAATLTVSTLPIGTDSLTAKYAGDANMGGSTSSATAFTVSNNGLTLTLSGGTATTTIATNGTATYAFMVTPGSSSTFGANVTFAVTGGPSGMTATFNPANIAAGSGATTVTLTMTGSQSAVKRGQAVALARGLSPLALGILLLPFAGKLRRSSKQMAGWVCMLLVLLGGISAVAGLSGCGGSSTPAVTTPAAQNYTVTVTATSGSESKSTTLALTVN